LLYKSISQIHVRKSTPREEKVRSKEAAAATIKA
jgi:hypothetical protein